MRSSSSVGRQPLGIFLPSKWSILNVKSWAAYHDLRNPTIMQSRMPNASSEVLSSWYGITFPSTSQMTTPTRTTFSLSSETSMPTRVHHDSSITSRYSLLSVVRTQSWLKLTWYHSPQLLPPTVGLRNPRVTFTMFLIAVRGGTVAVSPCANRRGRRVGQTLG